jgi:lipopolysaccharide transport system permease protein
MSPPAPQLIAAARAPLGAELRELWAHRDLLYFLVWREIKIRYKQTVIGAAWAVLQPVGVMLVFWLIFGKLLDVKTGVPGLPYPLFAFAALVPWFYFSHALAGATGCMVEQKEVLTRVYFPRLLLPLAAILTPLVDFALALAVLGALMAAAGIAPTAAVLALPAFALMAVASALGLGLWLAALNAVYRDFRYVVPFGIQLLFFATPIIYPSALVPERFRPLYGLNPMAGVVEGFRWCLLGAGEPPGAMVAASAAAVGLLLIGGLAFFRRMEATVTDVV